MLRFACPHCGNVITCPDQTAGQMGTCRKCQGPVRAPRPADNVWVPDGMPIRQQIQPSAMERGFKAGFGGALGVGAVLLMLALAPFVLVALLAFLGHMMR